MARDVAQAPVAPASKTVVFDLPQMHLNRGTYEWPVLAKLGPALQAPR
jgi:hypothetical protein